MRTSLLALGEALRFLTILPLPGLPPSSDQSIARAISWFPMAGLVIGVLLLPVGWFANAAWGPDVRAACLVIVWGIITGGMHLDGLSDTFDGVMSWRPRERKLEIMRDSRVGVMGVLAIVAVLLLKFVWLRTATTNWWCGVLLAPMWGRWADFYSLACFPVAREGGLGQTFRNQVRLQDFFLATLVPLLFSIVIAQWHGLIAALLVWVIVSVLAYWWINELGGLTGDTYGAVCEISEVVVLATLTWSLSL